MGSTIEISKGGFVFAQIHPSSYQHYGRYDYTKNLQDMVESVKKLRNMNVNTSINKQQIKSLSTNDASNNVNNGDT